MRAVSSGSSASAVPIPTATASHSARQWCARVRLSSPEIHFESPLRRRHLAVERHRGLEQHPGTPGPGVLAKRLVEQPRAVGEIAVGEHHLDAVVAQDPQAAPGGVLAGVVGGDDHAPDPGVADRVGARRRPALVAAGLQRHVQRGLRQVEVTGGRGSPPPRRAASRGHGESPRRRPRRAPAITAPTSGFGLTRPRPCSASSIARARWMRSVSARSGHRRFAG